MKLVHQPEGVEKAREWPFEPSKMMSPDAEAIERLTGMTFGQWHTAVLNDSMLARRALLFVLLRKDVPGLKFETLQISMESTRIEFELGEKREAVDNLRKKVADGDALSTEEQGILDEWAPEVDEADATEPSFTVEDFDTDGLADEGYPKEAASPLANGSASATGL